MPRYLLDEINGRTHIGRIVGASIPHEQRPVATDARIHTHVLLAIRAQESNGVPHDSGADLELREHLPRGGIDRLEPTIERPVEHHVAGGSEHPAPARIGLLDLPHLAGGRWIPGDERAQVAARTGFFWSVDFFVV